MNAENPPQNPSAVPLPLEPIPVITRWQYLSQNIGVSGLAGNVDPKLMNETLNWYGSQGWELVSAFPTAALHGDTGLVVLIFKRPFVG